MGLRVCRSGFRSVNGLCVWWGGVLKQTYGSPSAWHHEVFWFFVCEGDEAVRSVSVCPWLWSGRDVEVPHDKKCDILHSSFRHGYPSAVQVLLQSLVEFRKPSKLELGHGLLLALAVVVCTDFVRGGHGGSVLCDWRGKIVS